jgi:hypothetical protein
MDDFKQSALRWLKDGECLLQANRHGGATHAFGLAAECALKHAMDNLPGGERELPHKHLPELIDNAKLWLQGRTHRGLYQLINTPDYMEQWTIANRYWPDDQFSQKTAERYHDHARRTCIAADLTV